MCGYNDLYMVDYGNNAALVDGLTLHSIYSNAIDKKEYRDFSDWMFDMSRSGLVTKVGTFDDKSMRTIRRQAAVY